MLLICKAVFKVLGMVKQAYIHSDFGISPLPNVSNTKEWTCFSETVSRTFWQLGMTVFERPELLCDDGSRSSVGKLFSVFFS